MSRRTGQFGTDRESHIALVYLLAPAVVYALTFLRQPLGLLLAILLVTSASRILTSSLPKPAEDNRSLAAALFACALVTIATGYINGAYAWDWIKHWALLNLLVDASWPATFVLDGTENWLRFYVGAYLIPAGLTKTTGLPLALSVASCFSAGIFLILRLCNREDVLGTSARAWAIPIVLLFVTGADGLAQLLLRWMLNLPYSSVLSSHSEWWSDVMIGNPLQYSSLLTQFTWVPHQAIASGLVTLLTVRRTDRSDFPLLILSLGTLCLFSPYAAIGTAPFLLLKLPRSRSEVLAISTRWENVLFAATGLGLAASAIVNLRVELPDSALLCLECITTNNPLKPILFLIVELLPLALCLRRKDLSEPQVQLAFTILLALPFIGSDVTDPVMRISMPALLLLSLRAARNICAIGTSPSLHATDVVVRMAVAIGFMGITTLGEAGFHLSGGSTHRKLPKADHLASNPFVDFARSTDIDVVEFFERCGWKYKRQYFSVRKPPLYGVPDAD